MDRPGSLLVLLVQTWDLAGLIISSPFLQLWRPDLPSRAVLALSVLQEGAQDGLHMAITAQGEALAGWTQVGFMWGHVGIISPASGNSNSTHHMEGKLAVVTFFSMVQINLLRMDVTGAVAGFLLHQLRPVAASGGRTRA